AMLAEGEVLARRRGAQGGVVLLSPGAPSFGAYRDYVARGRHFAELAGFDPDSISAIPGLGIA
ncbi:UDP-N-acetylmuramoyl-L-alanine--D-glutamate ligase, partial [Stenotrophomonas maltophilia]